MENIQKFMPEGWNQVEKNYNLQEIRSIYEQGEIIQGIVNKCDENFNLQVNLGNNIIGVIPRNEMDAVNFDNFGMTNPNICKHKVNQYVQFKVKEIYDENRILLSRKEAQKNALEWIKNDLKEGMIVNRNSQKYKEIWSFC